MKLYPFRVAIASIVGISLIAVCAPLIRAEYPKPSPYPISWQLKFDHGTPQRIVVQVPGIAAPQAYWYITYTVTNNTKEEQVFLPVFEMLTGDGKVTRSDNNVSSAVFDAIKAREKRNLMEPWTKLAGELRLGTDQAKDGVAIWPEPMLRMERFNIFVQGLSGEAVHLKDDSGVEVKDKDGKPIILRKTLQLNYHINGDEVYPGEDDVNVKPSNWVMR